LSSCGLLEAPPKFKTTSFELETEFKKKLNFASFAFAQKLTSIYLASETRYDLESFAFLAVTGYSYPLKPHEVWFNLGDNCDGRLS
jgi:hypothetical protein